MHQIVVDAINRTDLDLRKSLYSNIVLSGGSTLTKGFGDRLLLETQKLAVKDMRIKIFAPPERKYSTWIGGSILAGLSTFRKVSLLLHNDRWCALLMSVDVGEHRRLAREPRYYSHKVHLINSYLNINPIRSIWQHVCINGCGPMSALHTLRKSMTKSTKPGTRLYQQPQTSFVRASGRVL